MSRAQVLASIKHIQEVFPAQFIEQMWLKPVTASNLDALLACILPVND